MSGTRLDTAETPRNGRVWNCTTFEPCAKPHRANQILGTRFPHLRRGLQCVWRCDTLVLLHSLQQFARCFTSMFGSSSAQTPAKFCPQCVCVCRVCPVICPCVVACATLVREIERRPKDDCNASCCCRGLNSHCQLLICCFVPGSPLLAWRNVLCTKGPRRRR